MFRVQRVSLPLGSSFTLVTSVKYRYTGCFKNGQRCGTGEAHIQHNNSTLKYVGQWVNGQMFGEGVLTVSSKCTGGDEQIDYTIKGNVDENRKFNGIGLKTDSILNTILE